MKRLIFRQRNTGRDSRATIHGKDSRATKMKKTLTQIGIVLPIFFFLLMLFTYAVNVPWFDDIDAFPETVVQWIQGSFWDGIKLLFRPKNCLESIAQRFREKRQYHQTKAHSQRR